MQVLALEVMSSFSHTSWGKLNIINNNIVDIKFSCKSVLGAYLNICKKFQLLVLIVVVKETWREGKLVVNQKAACHLDP